MPNDAFQFNFSAILSLLEMFLSQECILDSQVLKNCQILSNFAAE